MISIVIPTYNRAKIISNVLDNLLAQTNSNWQCVVVDDHSTDNTFDVVQHYVVKDPRFVYLTNNRSKGAQGARNTGVLAAEGEWICLFDSDDIMYPTYIERMQEAIENGIADIYVCYANIRSMQTGQLTGRLDKIAVDGLHERLLNEISYVAYDVCVIRKQKLIDIGLLDEHCPSMQEWDTHIRLSKCYAYYLIPDPLCEWTIGGLDTITYDNMKHINGMSYIYAKHCRDFRRYAYRHYLNALTDMWTKIEKPWRLLRLAPELIVYKPLRKLIKR